MFQHTTAAFLLKMDSQVANCWNMQIFADMYLAPALATITHDTRLSQQALLDYAGLQIGHLGAIYETLLTMRLTRAVEDLVYDSKNDKYLPFAYK